MPTAQASQAFNEPGSLHLVQPRYRPHIVGLRALGVLLVVAFHAFPKALPGGFVGVDIFFVVSGFLISTIIFGSLENKSFSFQEFYARRVRRIFPALAIVLATGWAIGWRGGAARAGGTPSGKTGEDRPGHAEEARGKARVIGDIEIDEPVHGQRIYALSGGFATVAAGRP